MHSDNVVSGSSTFIFYGAVQKETDGYISGGWFVEYVSFKVRQLSDYKQIRETYTSVVSYVGLGFEFVFGLFVY